VAHVNELNFLRRHLQESPATVLEIGSKHGKNMMPWRTLYPHLVGLDIDAGEGVDVVHDYETGPLPNTYELVLCCSVLEHMHRPWMAAPHIGAAVAPGGMLYVTVPWTWRQHDYPIDWWRMSVEGIKSLFEGFDWLAETYATTVKDDFRPTRSQDVWNSSIKGKAVNVCLTELSQLIGRKR